MRLKPCACGYDPHTSKQIGKFTVRCINPRCHIPQIGWFDTKEEAAEVWNGRMIFDVGMADYR